MHNLSCNHPEVCISVVLTVASSTVACPMFNSICCYWCLLNLQRLRARKSPQAVDSLSERAHEAIAKTEHQNPCTGLSRARRAANCPCGFFPCHLGCSSIMAGFGSTPSVSSFFWRPRSSVAMRGARPGSSLVTIQAGGLGERGVPRRSKVHWLGSEDLRSNACQGTSKAKKQHRDLCRSLCLKRKQGKALGIHLFRPWSPVVSRRKKEEEKTRAAALGDSSRPSPACKSRASNCFSSCSCSYYWTRKGASRPSLWEYTEGNGIHKSIEKHGPAPVSPKPAARPFAPQEIFDRAKTPPALTHLRHSAPGVPVRSRPLTRSLSGREEPRRSAVTSGSSAPQAEILKRARIHRQGEKQLNGCFQTHATECKNAQSHLAVGQKWFDLVSANMDQDLWSISWWFNFDAPLASSVIVCEVELQSATLSSPRWGVRWARRRAPRKTLAPAKWQRSLVESLAAAYNTITMTIISQCQRCLRIVP